jgi:D-arabinose 1-dehydrogenase-like Zn-dependent alcohol dehydrogenase
MLQRCYCLTHHFAPLERRDQEVPALKEGEVLVRIKAAGVCHSDIHIWEGHYDLGAGKKITLKDRGISLPLTLGHEIAGEVVGLGANPADPSVLGAQVVVFPWLGCGVCATCKRGDENLCLKSRSLGVFQSGGYAEYVVVPSTKYCLNIDGLDAAEAAPLACSGVTTFSAIKKFGTVIQDEPVVIMGAGGLGTIGAKGEVVVDIDAANREAALKAGALGAIDGAAPDAAQQIIAATQGGARLVLDLVGAPSTVNLAIASATRGTEIVVVGLYGGEVSIPVPFFPLRPIAIRGSYVGNLAELQELVALAKAGQLKPVPVIRRPLDEAHAALMDLKAGKVIGRTVLVP